MRYKIRILNKLTVFSDVIIFFHFLLKLRKNDFSGRKVEDKGHVEKENVRAESKIQYYWGGNRAKLNNIQCRIIEVEGENNQSKEEAKRSGLLSRSKLR